MSINTKSLNLLMWNNNLFGLINKVLSKLTICGNYNFFNIHVIIHKVNSIGAAVKDKITYSSNFNKIQIILGIF